MSDSTMDRRAWLVGDDVDGDTGILPLRFTAARSLDRAELRAHLFSTLRPDLSSRIQSGDVIVAGENFACGRLHAQPIMALRESGVVIVAASVPYLAYRRMIDAGVHLLICPDSTSAVTDGERVRMSEDGSLLTTESGASLRPHALPLALRRLVDAGGFEAALAREVVARKGHMRLDQSEGLLA